VNVAWASPDARILSILHAKNLEEIKVGQLASQNGSSDAARQYGEMLVQDHTELDARVKTTAGNNRIHLMQPSEVGQLLQKETGKAPGDPIAELQQLSGTDFDQKFAQMMRDGHQELIQIVQSAQKSVTKTDVGGLLTDTLPTLEKHLKEVDTMQR
jgi:putative membrane protein